ncbi:TonB family protein [Terriglobus roseus DSM 18391]|uniref:TonB family protein n=2 Tax=Terriglobus roseus TaxID=392734 RepID=I3ZBD6_TERRK|nr:TonB family protein [Terriglobus roseus DSM 18391]
MFQDSLLVESSGRLKSKSSCYVWVTATFNAAVVAVAVLLPLLYPDALPRMAMTAMLSAPPAPPAAPAPPPVVSARVARVTASVDPFVPPARVPRHLDMTRDDPPPSVSGVVRMTGGGSGDGPGVIGSLGLGPAPPVVSVAVARPVVGPARVSSGVMAGQIVTKTTPVYPAIAKAAHVSGAVVLHAVISKTGAIESLSVVSGHEMLRASAVAAVQGWRYRPYLLNGDPTEVETTITVNFSFGG